MLHQLKTADKWLISAIKGSVEQSITDAINEGGNVNIAIEEGTPLHLAISKDNLQIAELLTKRGADINLVNRDFLTPIDFAMQSNKFEMLRLLITERQVYNKDTFDMYVKYCFDNYTHTSGLEYENANHELIAHYASRLTGVNVVELLKDNHNNDRYVVHLYAYKTALKDDVPLEGWSEEIFLSLRIYTFLEILVKTQKDIIKVHDAIEDARNKTLHQLTKEILTEVETLRTVRDRLAIFNANFSEEQKAELYTALANRVAKQIASLNEGEIYCLACGYKGHTFYVNFTKTNDKIFIRVDNLGAESDKHLKKPIDGKIHLAPYKLGCSTVTQFTEKGAAYLLSLLKGRDTWDNPKIARQHIYDEVNILETTADDPTFYPKMEEQSANNCVTANHQVGVLLRSYEPKFYDWLINQERQVIVNHNRTHPNLYVTRDDYWNDQYLFISSAKSVTNAHQDYQIYDDYDIKSVVALSESLSELKFTKEFRELTRKLQNIADCLYENAINICSNFIKTHGKNLPITKEYCLVHLFRGYARFLFASSLSNPKHVIYEDAKKDFIVGLNADIICELENSSFIIEFFELTNALCSGKIGTLTNRQAFHEEVKNNLKPLFHANYKNINAFAYFNSAIAHDFCNQYEESINYYKTAKTLFSQMQNESDMCSREYYWRHLLIKTTLNLGCAYFQIKKIDDAKRYFEEVLSLISYYKTNFQYTSYDISIKQIEEHANYGLGLVYEAMMNNAEDPNVKGVAAIVATKRYGNVLKINLNHTGAQRHLNNLTVRVNKLAIENSPKRRKIEPDQPQDVSNAEIRQNNPRFSPNPAPPVTDFFSPNSAEAKKEETIHSTEHQIPVEQQKNIF